MKKPNTIERDINRIRLKIHEETKDMTPAQHVEFVKRRTDPIIKKYGFKLVEKPESRLAVAAA